MRSLVAALAPVVALALLGADAPPPRVLVATRSALILADGNARRALFAGADARAFRLAGAVDGGVLAAYDDLTGTVVALVTPSLAGRVVKRLTPGATVWAADRGFVANEVAAGLLRRYDLQGNLVGAPVPALASGVATASGDALFTAGGGRLTVWDARGRMRKQRNLDVDAVVALPQGRVAVNDTRDGEVRVYDADLEQKAVLRYVGLTARTLASAPDGTLAVLAGNPSCVTSNTEIDVFTDLHAQPAARIKRGLADVIAIAVDADSVVATNGACAPGGDGSVVTFARDGATRGTVGNVGSPLAAAALPSPSPSPSPAR